jgi:helix-turn-helix protein
MSTRAVPVKIEHEGAWVTVQLGISEDRMSIPAPMDEDIPFKKIQDLEERKNELVVTAGGHPPQGIRIRSVEKVLSVLKRLILAQCSAYRLAAYFMSPAIRGGVLITDAQWEKGSIAVVKTGIWFVSKDRQICVPLARVTNIELTKRDVQGKQLDVVMIDYLEGGSVVSSLVLCPLSTLQLLLNFLKDATKGMEIKADELDPVAQQVAMLVYSGMDSHAIENMLNIPHKQLDSIYDRLLELQIAEVAMMRREIQLTPKGVKYISDATKSQIK